MTTLAFRRTNSTCSASVPGWFRRHSRAVQQAAVVSAVLLVGGLAEARAADELAELKAQLAALQAKVAELEAKQKAMASAPVPGLDPALREKLEKQPVLSFDSRGLRVSSPERTVVEKTTEPDGKMVERTVVVEKEGDYKFHLGALLQPQGRFFIDTPDATSTFLMRRARLILDGTFARHFDFLFQTDLQSAGLNDTLTTGVQDAWINAKASDWLQLRFGKMKSPLGVERWQSSRARWFTDFITTTYLVPNRSIGAMLHGRVPGGFAEYYASLVNGEPNGGSSDFSSDGQNTKEFQGRLAVTPMAQTGWKAWEQLTLGAGVSYAPQLNGLGRYGTANRQQFFGYNNATVNSTRADPGEQVRFVPNVSYFWGPFGLYGEAAWTRTGVVNGNNRANLQDFGWQVAASYVVTGEDNTLRPIKVKRPFDPAVGRWGALQVAARAGQLQVDPGTFPIYADPDIWSRRTTTFGVVLNWLLNDNLRASLEYDYTSFLGGAPDGGNAPDNNAITTQFQLSF